jgi:hypothetical protein
MLFVVLIPKVLPQFETTIGLSTIFFLFFNGKRRGIFKFYLPFLAKE